MFPSLGPSSPPTFMTLGYQIIAECQRSSCANKGEQTDGVIDENNCTTNISVIGISHSITVSRAEYRWLFYALKSSFCPYIIRKIYQNESYPVKLMICIAKNLTHNSSFSWNKKKWLVQLNANFYNISWLKYLENLTPINAINKKVFKIPLHAKYIKTVYQKFIGTISMKNWTHASSFSWNKKKGLLQFIANFYNIFWLYFENLTLINFIIKKSI